MQKEIDPYSVSFDNVKNISFEKYDKNFTFIVDGKRYETSRFYADLISPIVNKYHYSDETINEITIHTRKHNPTNEHQEEEVDYFSDFLKLSTFEAQEIDEAHRNHYLDYFLQLGNLEEYSRLLQPRFDQELSTTNIVDRLLFIYSQPQQGRIKEIAEEYLRYASLNFEDISNEEKKKLDVEIISSILNDSNLNLKDEDSLLSFVLDMYETDTKYSILFEYVIFSNVSEQTLERFVTEFNIEFMNMNIWNRICDRLLHGQLSEMSRKKNQRYSKVHKKEDGRMIIEKEHREGDEFNGILRYLSEQSNGNIHDNRTVNITSNSICYDSCHPKNLVNYQNNEQNYYHSTDNNDDIYICFDMKDRRIQLTSYSIKSYAGGRNWNNLKNWKIEASKDGYDWTTIDEHYNDSTLNNSRAIGTFKIQNETKFYRFIRLHQTGQNWNNNNYLIFYCIEFYGKLKEPNKE